MQYGESKMTDSINEALSAARTDHADPEFDSHDIDHGVQAERQIGENEEMDFNAVADAQDAEGKAPSENGKLHTGTGSKSPTPFWVLRDFTWSSYINKLTGETMWNLRPNADVVNTTAAYAPSVLDQAYAGLSDEDKKAATAFGTTLHDLMTEAEAIDSWLEKSAAYSFIRDCAKNACSAVNWTQAQQEAQGRKAVKLAGEHEVRAHTSGRTAAMLKLALITAAPTLVEKINFKSAAWDLAKANAYRHQKVFMTPDEEATFKAAESDAITGSGFKLRAAS
jgi:hypothetical protein